MSMYDMKKLAALVKELEDQLDGLHAVRDVPGGLPGFCRNRPRG